MALLHHSLPGSPALRAALALAALLRIAGPASAVVAGSPADRTVSQSLVMVLAEGGLACSGVVIAPRAVLTPGHCLPNRKAIRIYAPTPGAPPEAPRLIPPSAKAVHPAYVPNAAGTRRLSIDLALIRLPEALPAAFSPARLSASPAPDAGAAVIVAGDGLADEAQPSSSGRPRSAMLTVIEPYGRGRILLWAAPASGADAGACKGDSGGAMFGTSGSLLAVIAFAEGAGKSRCGRLTQGVLVAPQRPFIDATLAGWGEAARWTQQ